MLSFIFGGSGAGKSSILQERIIQESLKHPEKRYLFLVPDQFTMETQRSLVEKHPCHGIMNIDVLSFGRLSYRVFEETGGVSQPVLDDTGKNLILRIVADRLKPELKVLGGYLKKQGYIHEIKSAISEFMQYGIGLAELEKIIAFSEKRGALAGKLKDLLLLYRGFEEYIRDHYLTKEESLQVLSYRIASSSLLRGSVLAFDGFTGFTPIQLQVIRELMSVAEEVCFTLLFDGNQEPRQEIGEQNLFALSAKTFRALEKCAEEAGTDRGEDLYLKEVPVKRLNNVPALAHLEQNLFRYPQKGFSGEPTGIHLAFLPGMREEARYAARMVRRLIREEGYYFRDIGVVCGNLENYESVISSEFSKLGIPFFIDQNRGILLNPFVEFIRSALRLYSQDFSVDAVNHYIRTGLTGLSLEAADELDNYIREMGIHGYGRWNRLFTRLPVGVDQKSATEEEGEGADFLARINEARQEIVRSAAFLKEMGKTASEKVRALYDFIEESRIQEKLAAFEKEFEEKGEMVRAREYHQIYPFIIDLLSEIVELSGGEEMTDQEFAELLDAGFSEMQVGTIPQNVDHVTIGDMQRSRLKEIRVLLFLGINDGNIPGNVGSGGILSDIDREFLQESEFELAPSPRQKMYTQRLYLYMNMTKPSEKLYMTWAGCDQDGKTLRPAYLVETVKKLYPDLVVETPEEETIFERLETWQDSYDYVADALREAVSGTLYGEREEKLVQMLKVMQEREETAEEAGRLMGSAFAGYEEERLPKQLALALCGSNLVGSITRLETFAACAYEHFLKYELLLEERKEFGFAAVDMGNIFHSVLAEFSEKLPDRGYSWLDFPKEEGEKLLQEILEAKTAAYGNAVLYETARSRYALKRIGRIMRRAVFTLQYQLQQGQFTPKKFEMSFSSLQDLEAVNVALTQEEKLRLVGRIDRLDTCEEDNKCYVKVIDYKSGKNSFDIVALYHGLQLQLVTYLNAAMEYEKKSDPGKEIVPAGILYYHIDDPVLEIREEKTPEEINAELRKVLRLTGIVNDDAEIIEKIDASPGTAKEVLPLSRKKDGSFAESSLLMSRENIELISDFAAKKLKELGGSILSGEIGMHPYSRKDREACTYCPYGKVCGFDKKLPGCRKRTLPEEGREEIFEKMRDEM
ncbi:MAG: helicase-exonuclease AddAB subunit AddB [Lachnospiraceae bacterium]|jgi:ATP-dependent helicase/nuclease subunit B|nr:helicase-exonuclease AddAB subunit AddB [Lachnospiraceae bacterium]